MLNVKNPANGKIIKKLKTDTPQTVKKKFEAARKAQKAWAARSLQERIAIVRKFKELLVSKKDELAQVMMSETGKPIALSLNELNAMPGRIDFFLENTEKTLAPLKVLTQPDIEETIGYEPLGVILNISAWNYPWFVGSNVWVPALIAGNAVLYKPSEFAALTGLKAAELFHEAGVPKEIFAPVIGLGNLGAEMLKLPAAGVYFTGSVATGMKIAEAASKKLMKTQLELGGKDPVYICEDVDVKNVAAGTADGAFYNNGQSCCSVERIYVHEKIYDEYVKHFVDTVKGFKMGDPTSKDTYLGPLTREPQIKVLEAQIRDAKKKGAKVLAGGKKIKGKGYYFEPTVLVNVNHKMTVMRDESFGPIIGIQKVKSDEEATALMNDTTYGLTAGVYTRDRTRAERILAQLEAGSAYWNCCDRVSPRLPWTGRKHSGLGSTLSIHGIYAFVQPKGWHLRKA